jgi:hypothetical protein
VFFVAARDGHQVQLSSVWWRIALDAPTPVMSVLIGRMLARWAPGRELCVCLAYGILGAAFSFMMMFVSPWVFLSDVAQRTPVLAGALWGRRRTF